MCLLHAAYSFRVGIWLQTRWVITATRLSDPQQTGFKGNLRLLIKPFEQPHLPFKILSAALHCWLLPCPPHASQFGLRLPTERKDWMARLSWHLAFTLRWIITNELRATLISAALVSYVRSLMLRCIFRDCTLEISVAVVTSSAAHQTVLLRLFWLSLAVSDSYVHTSNRTASGDIFPLISFIFFGASHLISGF